MDELWSIESEQSKFDRLSFDRNDEFLYDGKISGVVFVQ